MRYIGHLLEFLDHIDKHATDAALQLGDTIMDENASTSKHGFYPFLAYVVESNIGLQW